jgi:hypothetical protein
MKKKEDILKIDLRFRIKVNQSKMEKKKKLT